MTPIQETHFPPPPTLAMLSSLKTEEELQKMNDQVIQKLLDFDLVCAQNLLENLCIC